MPAQPRLWLAVVVGVVALTACGSAPPSLTPTPAVVARVSTPFAAYAAATPPAQLHDRPGGAPGETVPRGTDLRIEDAATTADGQLWYRVTTPNNAGGWLPAAAISLVDRPVVVLPTPLPTLTPAATPAASPTPRALVVAGSGQGLFLRARPGQGEVIRVYPDGTRVVPLGDETQLDGRRWLRVRAPDGREGWMAADYLRPG